MIWFGLKQQRLGHVKYQSPTSCTQNVLKAFAGNKYVVEQSELCRLGYKSENVACFHFTQETVFSLNSESVSTYADTVGAEGPM